MSNRLLAGATGKFAESFGSGLAYGIVVLIGIAILHFWILKDDPIVRLTPAAVVCGHNDVGTDCQVIASCEADEIAIGGECSVSKNFDNQDFWLHNFGLYEIDASSTNLTPQRIICNWGGPAANSKDKEKELIPHVRAACIKKSRFLLSTPFEKG